MGGITDRAKKKPGTTVPAPTPVAVREPTPIEPSPGRTVQPAESTTEASRRVKHGFDHKLLWYIPNRLIDFTDVFRLRLRLGLGGAVGFRVTDNLSLFGGWYKSVYAGFPGPRRQVELKPPWGREDLKGLMILGVDATDDTPYHPGYTVSEATVSAHLLLVGLDAGFDLIEFADLAGGFLFIDHIGDDH